MNILALLINGVSLPHHVVDKSLHLAMHNKMFIKVVIVFENIDEKDYTLPKNIPVSRADLSDSNAAKSMEDLIRHNSEYIESTFIQHKVDYNIIILKNPDIAAIELELKDADKILIDHETFTHPDEFAYINISEKDLTEHIATKIEWCKRK